MKRKQQTEIETLGALTNSPQSGLTGNDSAPGRRLLNIREASHFLNIGLRMLWTLTRCGEIPHVRIGRRVLYSIVDLDSFIARKRNGGAR